MLGVTAYLNHEKMVDMEQTLAQMKGTRYVTEAQTADTEDVYKRQSRHRVNFILPFSIEKLEKAFFV